MLDVQTKKTLWIFVTHNEERSQSMSKLSQTHIKLFYTVSFPGVTYIYKHLENRKTSQITSMQKCSFVFNLRFLNKNPRITLLYLLSSISSSTY
jgi:hypothetical protein